MVRDGIIVAVMNREMRTHHHQHRQHPRPTTGDRDPHRREHQIALRLIPGLITDPVRRVLRGVLRPDPSHVLPEPRRRPGPPNPLGEHRRRQPRIVLQQSPDLRFHRLDSGLLRRPFILRRINSPTAFATVFLEIPNRLAIDLIDSPSARCNRLISAQSSTVITHPIVRNRWLSSQPSQRLNFRPSPTREKHRAWSDCGGDISSRFSDSYIATLASVYWFTNSIGTSFRPYYEFAAGFTTRVNRVGVPTAVALFPYDLASPPRSWAERTYEVTRYTLMPRGSHFAPHEEPDLLADDIRAFLHTL